LQDGNHVDPIHYYDHSGEYNVCLIIKTLKGCEQEKCTLISIDSLLNENEIVNLYPNPATTQLLTVIRSNNNNVQCFAHSA